jgi:peptide/nickel transport system substrate-binding protein
MQRRDFLIRAGAISAAVATASSAVFADGGDESTRLKLGVTSAPNSLDPHFYQSPVNNQALRQLFDPLVIEDVTGRSTPGLATRWQPISDKVWEFTLRPGVTFHDGTPFDARDVAFSIQRIPKVPNSPGSFLPFVRNITHVEIVDATTVRISTATPYPFLARDLASVFILSHKIHADATTADFTTGRAAIGTGAFKYAGFAVDDHLDLTRNPNYWGGASPWTSVHIRYVPDAGARSAGLLSGEFDLIDGVPPQNVARFAGDARLGVFGVASATTVYLFPDTVRDQAPYITDHQNRPLDRNPFKDARVRRALSLSINRELLVDRLLDKQGLAADQFAPPPATDRLSGTSLPYDPAQAKKLLAEAGYPDGFRLTIHGPTGFFTADAAVLQAVGQSFSRIGITTEVTTLPSSNFFGRATQREFALFMGSYASTNTTDILRQVVVTKNDITGTGPFNRQRYSNPKVDAPEIDALQTLDDGRRRDLTQQAARALEEDAGILSVFYPRYNWAGKKEKVRFVPGNAFGHTSATFVQKA